jgi:hypothetical protein
MIPSIAQRYKSYQIPIRKKTYIPSKVVKEEIIEETSSK